LSKTFTFEKDSAIIGLVGLVFFFTGFVLTPNLFYNINGININPFTILGFIFFGISLLKPFYNLKK